RLCCDEHVGYLRHSCVDLARCRPEVSSGRTLEAVEAEALRLVERWLILSLDRRLIERDDEPRGTVVGPSSDHEFVGARTFQRVELGSVKGPAFVVGRFDRTVDA